MKLTVIMLDNHRTYIAVVYENDHIPYGRRTVQIELTPEQMTQITPRKLGVINGKDKFEEIGPCWLETEQTP